MEILKPTLNDISEIIQLAHTTWNETYISIISKEQIDFMLNKFYNHDLIHSQLIDPNHTFFKAEENNKLQGYLHAYKESDYVKLSKLYILPHCQGKSVGKKLLHALEMEMKENNQNKLVLNVNRANPALNFYKKMGFAITATVDIPLDKYWLNDYVMEKEIKD